MSITGGIGALLLERTSRRGFLARATVTATALSVAPVDLLTRPGTAYGFVCQCVGGTNCGCSQPCCDGYTQFCCTINNGINACPPGTFAGGWWKADGSAYCSGPRYFIDCHGECHGCGCGGGSFCPSCDDLTCECALGSCDNMHVGCTEFRYGQCHQEIGCSGRIACRVVSCNPPWQIDSTCTTVAQTDDNTANHFAPCQSGPTTYPATIVGMAPTPTGRGYWLVGSDGGLYTFGDALFHGSLYGVKLSAPIVGMAATSTGQGYWMVAADGGIFTFGDAGFDGSTGSVKLASPIVGIAVTSPAANSQGEGYWMVAADGGIFTFGDAGFDGSTGSAPLTEPVVAMAPTPTQGGYWMVAADGGIFTFGDALFYGSLGSVRLSKPIVGMATTKTGKGYWLVGADGGIFTFGDALFYGSTASSPPAKPVVGMATTPTGLGYWLVTSTGAVFSFGDAQFYGALG